ncbi:MAG: 5'-methylthioadenosine/S-adenosylhomocysteine nucleosidase, partial [Clostridia bacterium]|nr:5'-methylthioadenosine/S-adenosylhomocysteine nucleosidase [Clostridia bacterium]
HGIIATGDQFIADGERKKKIVETFGAVSCEMEGGAVAQVCSLNNVPFAVIRTMSDSADGGALDDYPAFAKRSAEISAKIVIRAVTLVR